MKLESGQSALILPSELYRNLREVGESLADKHTQDIDDARVLAVEVFVRSYIKSNSDEFLHTSDGKPIYVGFGGNDR